MLLVCLLSQHPLTYHPFHANQPKTHQVAKAAKREQHVAVCVLKVWVPQQAAAAAATTTSHPAAAGATAATGSSSKPAGAAPAPKKRKTQQGSILSFLAPAAAKQSGAANGEGEVQSEEELQRSGAAASYLLVQRPAQGLLAGLWECPAVIVSDGAAAAAAAGSGSGSAGGTAAQRRGLADDLLSRLGVNTSSSGDSSSGSGGVRVVARHHLGSVVHVFSHIRQTSHVEQLVLTAPSLDAVCAAAAVGAAGGGAAADAADADADAGKGGKGKAAAAAKGKKKGKKKRGGGGGSGEDDDEDDRSGGEREGADVAEGALPSALRWVSQRELRGGDEGLTSGVRKVLGLAHVLAGEGEAAGKKAAGTKK